MTEKTLDFPNKRELRNSNDVEFKVFIPSTRAMSKKISATAFRTRVNEAVNYFSRLFGGSTIDVESGAYQYKNKIIKEKVAVIVINARKEDYNKYDERIERWLKEKKKSWGQDSMGFIYQGKMIFI